MRRFILFSALLLAAPALAQAQPQPDPAMQIQVVDARLAPARSGQTSQLSALLRNPTQATLTLTGISTPMANQVLFQRYTTDAQGFRKLTAMSGILLPPDANVVVTPGALEIKFLGITHTLERDMETPLTLHFSNGTRRTIRVTIQGSPSHE